MPIRPVGTFNRGPQYKNDRDYTTPFKKKNTPAKKKKKKPVQTTQPGKLGNTMFTPEAIAEAKALAKQKPATSKINAAIVPSDTPTAATKPERKSGLANNEDFMQFAGVFANAIGRAATPAVQPYAPTLATGVRSEITQAAAQRQNATAQVNTDRQRLAMQDSIAQKGLAMDQSKLEMEGSKFEAEQRRLAQADIYAQSAEMRKDDANRRAEDQNRRAETNEGRLDTGVDISIADAERRKQAAEQSAGLYQYDKLEAEAAYDYREQTQASAIDRNLLENELHRKFAPGSAEANRYSENINNRMDEHRLEDLSIISSYSSKMAKEAYVNARVSNAVNQTDLDFKRATYTSRLQQQEDSGNITADQARISRETIEDTIATSATAANQAAIDYANTVEASTYLTENTELEHNMMATNYEHMQLNISKLQTDMLNAADDRERQVIAADLYVAIAAQDASIEASKFRIDALRAGNSNQASYYNSTGNLSRAIATNSSLAEDDVLRYSALSFLNSHDNLKVPKVNVNGDNADINESYSGKELNEYVLTQIQNDTSLSEQYLKIKSQFNDYVNGDDNGGAILAQIAQSNAMLQDKIGAIVDETVTVPADTLRNAAQIGQPPHIPKSVGQKQSQNAPVQQLAPVGNTTQPARTPILPTAPISVSSPEGATAKFMVNNEPKNVHIIGDTLSTDPVDTKNYQRFLTQIQSGPVYNLNKARTKIDGVRFMNAQNKIIHIDVPKIANLFLRHGAESLSIMRDTSIWEQLSTTATNLGGSVENYLVPRGFLPPSEEELARQRKEKIDKRNQQKKALEGSRIGGGYGAAPKPYRGN